MLTPVEKIPTYACIIRATWSRGSDQREALVELLRRGTWLTEDQREHGKISAEAYAEAQAAARLRS